MIFLYPSADSTHVKISAGFRLTRSSRHIFSIEGTHSDLGVYLPHDLLYEATAPSLFAVRKPVLRRGRGHRERLEATWEVTVR
jgi:hypothetical protein